jgi:glutamate decarboxylase
MVFLSSLIKTEKSKDEGPSSSDFVESTVYGSRHAWDDIPRYKLPERDMPAKTAYKLIRDELALDGNPILNLASFVTTYMEEEADKLMVENMSKNFIDWEEYPETADVHVRCVNMVARLFNAPVEANEEALGCSTIGSSEAIMLAVLAMKRRWQQRRKAEGKDCSTPNLVMGSNVQVCWEKATRYFEIEERFVNVTEDLLCMDPKKAVDLVDENTIGVVAILGSTYTGHYEDVKTLNQLLNDLEKKTGLDVGIHVDAASGGFVAPFVVPDLEWDFRCNKVYSINASGHKYGLCYPGIGWAVWREKKYLPEDLVFKIDYLGSEQASFTLNFSKSASNVISQYYVFVRYGRAGFTSIMKNLTRIADSLAENLQQTGKFKILSQGGGYGLPLVAFSLTGNYPFDEFTLSHRLREKGWIVPAYHMAPDLHEMKLLRVVVREDFSRGRTNKFVQDVMAVLKDLECEHSIANGTKPENLSESRKFELSRLSRLFKLTASSISKFRLGSQNHQKVSGGVC